MQGNDIGGGSRAAGLDFPKPKDWKAFERLCADLWRHVIGDQNATLHGRDGERQAGVDLYAVRSHDRGYIGVQCKGRSGGFPSLSALTAKEIRDAANEARTFEPPLAELHIVTTAPGSATAQRVARGITEINIAAGKFEVHVKSWDDICRLLAAHQDIAVAHHLMQRQGRLSEISTSIGERMRQLLELINQDRSDHKRVSFLHLARVIGDNGWERVERVAQGSATTFKEVEELADNLRVNREWLAYGEPARPFSLPREFDLDCEPTKWFDEVNSIAPRAIVLVRNATKPRECAVVLKLDEVRSYVAARGLHISAENGGAGQYNLFCLASLIRRLRFDTDFKIMVSGCSMERELFLRMADGEVHPDVAIAASARSDWWYDFSGLGGSAQESSTRSDPDLLAAIDLVNQFRDGRREDARRINRRKDIPNFWREFLNSAEW